MVVAALFFFFPGLAAEVENDSDDDTNNDPAQRCDHCVGKTFGVTERSVDSARIAVAVAVVIVIPGAIQSERNDADEAGAIITKQEVAIRELVL